MLRWVIRFCEHIVLFSTDNEFLAYTYQFTYRGIKPVLLFSRIYFGGEIYENARSEKL